MTDMLLTLEKANMFCGMTAPTRESHGLYLELTDFKLPAFKENYVDHRPGGAPMGIEVDVVFGKLETQFRLLGWNVEVATLIDAWKVEQNVFWIYGLLRDRMSRKPKTIEAMLRGRLGSVEPEPWSLGALQHITYEIKGIIAYRLTVDETVVFDWNFFENRLIVARDAA
jgi:phage tail tube protein FII